MRRMPGPHQGLAQRVYEQGVGRCPSRDLARGNSPYLFRLCESERPRGACRSSTRSHHHEEESPYGFTGPGYVAVIDTRYFACSCLAESNGMFPSLVFTSFSHAPAIFELLSVRPSFGVPTNTVFFLLPKVTSLT